MLNKNTLGAKNYETNQKQQLDGYRYLAKAKNYTEYKIDNLLYWKCCMVIYCMFKYANKKLYNLIIQLQSFKGYSHKYDRLCHLATFYIE